MTIESNMFTGLLFDLYDGIPTPGENTGRWQLQNVSSAFNVSSGRDGGRYGWMPIRNEVEDSVLLS